MASKKKTDNSSKEPLKTPTEPVRLPWGTSYKFEEYKAGEVKKRERPQQVKKKGYWSFKEPQVATAADMSSLNRTIRNSQTHSATLYRKIDLIHYIQDPHSFAEKELMEAAMRRNFCVRVSIWIREHLAFKKSKLVIDLPQWKKMDMSEEEIQAEISRISDIPEIKEMLKKFETRDQNLKVPLQIKKCFWQAMGFGRFCTIIFYKDAEKKEDKYSEISRLLTVNSRRLEEPVLDENNDLSFEGIYIDGEALDKNSCIYGMWQERDISPHSEGYGYSPTEPVIYTAQAHNVLLEEDVGEIAKSAWLPTLLLKLDVSGASKSASIQQIINTINPGKIVGLPADDVVGEPSMLNMEPDFTGLVALIDSLEEKMYNNYHIPLFLVKSDKIANLATAKKSVQVFKDGTIADDQEQMEEIWQEQFYTPLLREELKKNNALLKTANPDAFDEGEVDTSDPQDAEMPLPFLIKRQFESPSMEDIEDIASLVQNKIIDLEEAHNRLNIPTDVTNRMLKKQEADKAEFEKNAQSMQEGKSPIGTPSWSKPQQKPTGSFDALRVAKANLVNELGERVKAERKKIEKEIASKTA